MHRLDQLITDCFCVSHKFVCSTLSESSHETVSMKKRKCRMGAGVEIVDGSGKTPGFALTDKPVVAKDERGFWKYEPVRNSKKMITTSMHCLLSWRANCKVDLIIYDSDPRNPDPMDVANVTDYIVAYSCKGSSSLMEERRQICDLISK